MHPNRRRKKRPNYGIRTVEVLRGPNGFGFTISGQQPCILSCIVTNSPADQAGLRAGDFLISVNGVSVSKIPHDAVVNLIGNSVGPIKMTIAENYYSDSSDEELDLSRLVSSRKPKYMHKPRLHRCNNKDVRNTNNPTESPIKKVMKLHENNVKQNGDSIFNGNLNNHDVNNVVNRPLLQLEEEAGPIEYKAIVGYLGTIEMPNQLLPCNRLQTVCTCIRKLRQEKRAPTAVLMTILPTCLTLKNSSNHILAIYPSNRVVYISSSTDKESRYFGLVTSATCENRSTENLKQEVASYQFNETKKFNNTDINSIDISNSCHVFVTDSKIIDHNSHIKKAQTFNVSCTTDVITGFCLEFPRNALYIVSLVQNMYRLQDPGPSNRNNLNNEELVANSPQPSASSNSDSGIGFRDDCGNVSDRILVVEFPSHRPLPIISPSKINNNRPSCIDISNITLDKLDVQLNNEKSMVYSYNNSKIKHFDFIRPNDLSKKLNGNSNNQEEKCVNLNNIRAFDTKSHLDFAEVTLDTKNRLTVRAMPLLKSATNNEDSFRTADIDTGQIYSERPIDVPSNILTQKSLENISLNTDNVDFKSSVDNISMHSSKSLDLNGGSSVFKTPSTKLFGKKISKRLHNMVSSCENLLTEKETYKLSPKVYGIAKPNFSCGELNNLESVDKCGYGSLQDLCFLNEYNENKRSIAQSEPDVRIQSRNVKNLCEENDISKSSNKSEGPAGWAVSFEKLLEDHLGLHTFAEFLKKEFSAENIYFWAACERFRRLPSGPERIAEARRIYLKHLCKGAPEAVNVDSQGRQCTEQLLQEADSSLFEKVQKQIYNLMKFDCYPRFLKSDLYKQCLTGNMTNIKIDTALLIYPATSPASKLKKSLSNAEDRRRKSLLPWHRKNRSKSKDRGESEYNLRKNELSNDDRNHNIKPVGDSDVHSSKSSLTSLDLAVAALNQDSSRNILEDISISSIGKSPLCRVILSNGSTTVVQIKQSETIQQLVNRLLEKRGILYSGYDVYSASNVKFTDLNDSSMKLAGCVVTVEQKVHFKLYLPNIKIISVKSKYTKIISDILKVVLVRYGYQIDQVKLTINNNPVDINAPVTSIDGKNLIVRVFDGYEDQAVGRVNGKELKDDITNKVYRDIIRSKGEMNDFKPVFDKCSVKSEDWGSEHSSGIFSKFLRRDSTMLERKKKSMLPRSKGNSIHSSVEDIAEATTKKPLIAKIKSGVKLHVANNNDKDDLVEGLNRAMRSRLEDQRGTEINFELPDFLKDKENEQNNNARKMRRTDDINTNTETRRIFLNESQVLPIQEWPPVTATAKSTKLELQSNYENRNIISSYNNIEQDVKKGSPSIPTSIVDNTNKSTENDAYNITKNTDPPPLPPKPKILPIKPSNWGQNLRPKPGLYLEQPTSSFV